ncbi:Uncharacterized protein QTN25_005443 [Entamoeba marina]
MQLEQTPVSTSRHKKALSTALLLLTSFRAGASIKFLKTKESHYAPKVLRGEEVFWPESHATVDTFPLLSDAFCEEMKRLIASARDSQQPTLSISNLALTPYRTAPTRADSRSKEAAFSNYLAASLANRGYILNTKVSGMKASVIATPFHTWESIVEPSGKVFGTASPEPLYSFINFVQNILYHSDNVVLSSDDFPPNILNLVSPREKDPHVALRSPVGHKQLSVFKPSNQPYHVLISPNFL